MVVAKGYPNDLVESVREIMRTWFDNHEKELFSRVKTPPSNHDFEPRGAFMEFAPLLAHLLILKNRVPKRITVNSVDEALYDLIHGKVIVIAPLRIGLEAELLGKYFHAKVAGNTGAGYIQTAMELSPSTAAVLSPIEDVHRTSLSNLQPLAVLSMGPLDIGRYEWAKDIPREDWQSIAEKLKGSGNNPSQVYAHPLEVVQRLRAIAGRGCLILAPAVDDVSVLSHSELMAIPGARNILALRHNRKAEETYSYSWRRPQARP